MTRPLRRDYHLSDTRRLALDTDILSGEFTSHSLMQKHGVSWSTVDVARKRLGVKLPRGRSNPLWTVNDNPDDREYRIARNAIIAKGGPVGRAVAELHHLVRWEHRGVLIYGG